MVWMMGKSYTYYGPTSVVIDNPGSTPLLNKMGPTEHVRLPPPPDATVRARQEEPYKRGLSDMFIAGGPVAVSDRFRLLVEAFEPGVHWFAPLIMERKNGEAFEGRYWLFHVQQDVDCLITNNDSALFKDMGYYETGKGGRERGLFCRLTEAGRSISISGPQIRGRHLWTAGLLGMTYAFCSDEFKIAVRKARMHGVLFDRECIVLDCPWIAEEQMGPLLPRHLAYVKADRKIVDGAL